VKNSIENSFNQNENKTKIKRKDKKYFCKTEKQVGAGLFKSTSGIFF
jgi:hypothetical protein